MSIARRWPPREASDVLKVQVTLLEPGDEALVRCRIIEHLGEDLMVEITSPRGSTRVQIGAREIMGVSPS